MIDTKKLEIQLKRIEKEYCKASDKSCYNCPLCNFYDDAFNDCKVSILRDLEEMANKLDDWEKEHPPKASWEQVQELILKMSRKEFIKAFDSFNACIYDLNTNNEKCCFENCLEKLEVDMLKKQEAEN